MNNEEAFLSSTFREFIKCWRSGTKARVIIESVNGHAFVNFSAFLGYPDDVHVKPRPSKRKPSRGPRKKSANKIQRDNDRAARYQERKRREGAVSASNNPEEAVATSSPDAESAMTISGLEFSFASPVPETLRQTSINEISTSMILSDVKEQTEQHEQSEQNEQNEQETDNRGEDQNVSYDDMECSKAAQKFQEAAPDEQTCEIHTKEMLERGRKQMISNIERFEHIPWWREDKLNYKFMKEKENEIARCRKCQIQKVRSEVRSLKSILWTDPSQVQKRIVTLGENLNSEK